jgi:hypothetical protein
MERFQQLYNNYSQDKISLQDFQMNLESILGDYEFLTKGDEEFILKTINKIELIIYTFPEDLQKIEVEMICPKILSYFKMKAV